MATNLTQEQRILALLRAQAGKWVPLPMILDLGIAQYNARIYALRRKGHRIENDSCWSGIQRHSYFRLVLPHTTGKPSPEPRARIQSPGSSVEASTSPSSKAVGTSRPAAAGRQLSLLESVAHAD